MTARAWLLPGGRILEDFGTIGRGGSVRGAAVLAMVAVDAAEAGARVTANSSRPFLKREHEQEADRSE